MPEARLLQICECQSACKNVRQRKQQRAPPIYPSWRLQTATTGCYGLLLLETKEHRYVLSCGRSRAKGDDIKPSGVAPALRTRPRSWRGLGCHFAQFLLQKSTAPHRVASRYSLPHVAGKPTTAMKKVKRNRQSDFHRWPPRPSARRQDLEEDRGRDHHHSLYS